MPKLFGELRERYLERPGGYTRVLRVEPEKEDQAPTAILQLCDGPKDMRFMLTAKTIARDREEGLKTSEITRERMKQVIKFRPDGKKELEAAVNAIRAREVDAQRRESGARKQQVYERRPMFR